MWDDRWPLYADYDVRAGAFVPHGAPPASLRSRQGCRTLRGPRGWSTALRIPVRGR